MANDELNKLIDNANCEKPKEKDRQALTRYLSEHPDAWRQIGDLSHTVREQILRSIRNVALTETTRDSLRDLKKRFQFDKSSPLEQLLIENILNCWLQYQLVEAGYTTKMGSSITAAQGQYWEKRLTAAQRRYLKAIETLAKVRKMNLPAIQVNIAQQQINSL